MKKLFLIVFLGSLLLLPLVSLAGEYKVDGKPVEYKGLVPCGKSYLEEGESKLVEEPCQFCHFFVMIDGIVDFILIKIVPPIAVLMLVIGGIMFFAAAGSPEKVASAKKILTSVVIGLVIIFAAWVIVNEILTFPGLIDPKFGWDPAKWFQVNCTINP